MPLHKKLMYIVFEFITQSITADFKTKYLKLT